MNDVLSSLFDRAPRYRLSRDGDINVVIEYEGEDILQTVPAALLDISTGGAKLQTDTAIPMRNIVMLQLQVTEIKRTLTVAGEVCWASPISEGKWRLGCSFRPRMPQDTLDELAQGNILERREHQRQLVTLRTMARFELSQEESPVWVLNISPGGFCLLAQRDGKPGERVCMLFEPENGPPINVRAKAQWQVETDEGYVVGCEFLDAGDYQVLSDLNNSTLPKAPGFRFAAGSDWNRRGRISNFEQGMSKKTGSTAL